MGLKDKVNKKVINKDDDRPLQVGLTPKEASFVITKLRQANYQGTEFETFYEVMKKLQLTLES